MNRRTLRILLIEDDEGDYIITKNLLAQSDAERFELVWAERLAAGLDQLAAPFDAILLDLSLPDSQGLETFMRVRGRAPHVPTILLTGLDDRLLGVTAVQQGAQDYLVKANLDGDVLARTILYAIERKKAEEQLEAYSRELRDKNRQMEEDLTMAGEVQRAFLPVQYPSFPPTAAPEQSALRFAHLYRPCTAIGGDFLSVFPVSTTVAGMLICDVMGHGVQAALIAALVRGLMDELTPIQHDAGRFLTETSRRLLSILKNPHRLVFVSAVYATLDSATGRLFYACAGHPSPMRLRPRARSVDLLRGTGDSPEPVLGVDPNHEYRSYEAHLEPGDRLVLLTDGLREVERGDGTQYGEACLVEALRDDGLALPLDKLLKNVLADAALFSGKDEFDDDICLAAVELVHLLEA